MNVVLKRVSEDIDLENPNDVTRYLVFDAEGKELRLPVPQETVAALVKFLYERAPGEEPHFPASAEEPEEFEEQPQEDEEFDEDAELFGGEDEDEAEKMIPPELAGNGIPQSEDEIPSL